MSGESSKLKNFRDLPVWQQAIELVEKIYILTAKFPKEENYELASQLRRSAVSIASNIAEGHTHDSLREGLQFFSVASVSSAEVQTQLYIARRLKLGDVDEIGSIEELSDKALGTLRHLQRSLKERL